MANKSIGRFMRSSLEMNDPLFIEKNIGTPLYDNLEQSNTFPDLSIIIPVYNEEKTVRSTINMIKKVVEKFNLSHEFLIINDGSTDSTRLEIENSGVGFIDLKQNRGKGNALRIGFEASKGKYILTVDADGSHQDEDIKNAIVSFFNSNLQMLIGSRFMTKPKERFTSPTNIVGNKLFTILLFLISRKVVTDSQSGLRIFNKQILQNVSIQSNGYEIESELTALALGKGYYVDEIPIECKPRKYGCSNLNSLKDGIKIFITLIRSYLHGRKSKS